MGLFSNTPNKCLLCEHKPKKIPLSFVEGILLGLLTLMIVTAFVTLTAFTAYIFKGLYG